MQKTLQFVAIQVHLNIIKGKQKRARITCLKPRARESGCRLSGVVAFSHQESFRFLTYPTAYLQPLPSGDHHLWWYMSPLTHGVEQWEHITAATNDAEKTLSGTQEENASVQTNAFSERNKKNLKNNEKNYMDKDLFRKSSSRNALCWAFYYVTNNKQVELTPPQAMHCIFSITIQFWN